MSASTLKMTIEKMKIRNNSLNAQIRLLNKRLRWIKNRIDKMIEEPWGK